MKLPISLISYMMLHNTCMIECRNREESILNGKKSFISTLSCTPGVVPFRSVPFHKV